MADSECEQIPSVTLYGTTQLTSTLTTHALITSIIRLDPTVSAGETVTPSTASVLSSQVITRTVITSLVPQQTLYSPCPGDVDSTVTGVAGARPTRDGAPAPAPAKGEETEDPQATGQFTGVIPSYQSIKSSATALTLSSYKTTARTLSSTTIAASSSHTAASSAVTSGISNNDTSGGASSGSSSTTSNDVGPIVGGVLGGVIGLVVLIALIACIRKRRRDRRDRDVGEEYYGDGEGEGSDYWERRFRQLEAEGERGEKRGSGETGGVFGGVQEIEGREEMARHKKLHLTLNLASKDLPSRPASRLSATSSFFAIRFNSSAMVTQSPSQRSTVLPKSSMDSSTPFRPPPALRSNSNDDVRSVRSGTLSRKSGLSLTGQSRQGPAGNGSKSPGANKLSLFFLPSMREEPQMVRLQDPPSAATSRPGSSLSLSIGPTPPAPTLASAVNQPRPSVERGQFSPTDSEVEERRNMEWIRHSTTTAKSRESEKYAGMRRDQLNSLLSAHGAGSENRGFLTASALRRISGLRAPSEPGQAPPKLGALGGGGGGVGVGAGHSKTYHPPSITSSVLPNLTRQSRAMQSELTPADSISVCDTDMDLENAPSESTFTMSTYSTHPSFGQSRPQSKRDSYKTLTMYKSERGSRPPSAPASAAGSRPPSRLGVTGALDPRRATAGDPRALSSARRSLYPPRRTPSGRIISLHSQPRSEHSASGSNPASPPPIPTRIVSGTPVPSTQPQPGARVSRSMREVRMSKGKHVPELRLSRRAITPSLWIDEEALARFADAPSGKSALSKIPSERAVDSPARKTFNVDALKVGLGLSGDIKQSEEKEIHGRRVGRQSSSKRGYNREGGAAFAKLESRFSDDTAESTRSASSRPASSKHSQPYSTPRTGIEIKLEPEEEQVTPPDASDVEEGDPYDGIHTETPKAPTSTQPLRLDKGKGKARALSISAPSAPVSPFSSAPPSPSSRRDIGRDEGARSNKFVERKKSTTRETDLPDAKHGDKIKRGSMISLSPTKSWTSSSSVSMEDAPIAKVDQNERSAVTPQLPVLALSSAGLGGWSIGGHGDVEENEEDDGEERMKSPSPRIQGQFNT